MDTEYFQLFVILDPNGTATEIRWRRQSSRPRFMCERSNAAIDFLDEVECLLPPRHRSSRWRMDEVDASDDVRNNYRLTAKCTECYCVPKLPTKRWQRDGGRVELIVFPHFFLSRNLSMLLLSEFMLSQFTTCSVSSIDHSIAEAEI